MTKPKRVLVVGAGASGLTSTKVCLESGLDVLCVERQADLGGLWNYKAGETEESCVMKSTVINTSKEMMAFSDFPPPAAAPNFMHNTAVMEYFRSYARHFRLLKHIRFATAVLSVKRAPDFPKTHKWIVRLRDPQGEEAEELFDGVLLCTGHHAAPFAPTFPGQDSFQGEVIHSHSYKDHRGLEDKRVVVVGVGNSGVDIAVELSRICAQVHLVTRRGTWVLNRVGTFGSPVDVQVVRRVAFWGRNLFPSVFDRLFEASLNARFDHANFGLLPQHGVMNAHPTINDDLPNRILCGSVLVKPNIRELRGRSVVFEDGAKAEDVDVLVLATGYSFGFPYLEDGIIPVDENRVELWENMYPPGLESPSLAVIGCVQPLGAIMPISELQARVFVEMLEGRAAFPSRGAMEASVAAKRRAMAERYVEARRHTIQVDYVAYMDELGELIGATPSVWQTFKRDPKLGLEILLGPTLPYHFRLQGPNPWPGARQAIMSVWDRVLAPTKTRQVVKKQSSMPSSFVIIAALIILFVLFFKVF